MNSIIYKRTTPKIRHQIQGIYLCEKLNKHLKERYSNFIIIYYFIKIVFFILTASKCRVMFI
jgi:hypothetical protein